jgi:hypothetical protein
MGGDDDEVDMFFMAKIDQAFGYPADKCLDRAWQVGLGESAGDSLQVTLGIPGPFALPDNYQVRVYGRVGDPVYPLGFDHPEQEQFRALELCRYRFDVGQYALGQL